MKSRESLSYLLLLTAFFMLLEVSFFIQCNRSYLADYTFMSSHLSIPLASMPGIAFFVFAQLLLHLIYCLIIWVLVLVLSDFLILSSSNTMKLCLIFWIAGVLTLLCANQYLFPNSRFAALTSLLLNPATVKWLLAYLVAYWVGIFLLSVLGVAQMIGGRLSLRVLFLFTLSYFVVSYYHPPRTNLYSVATAKRPNIIFVGVDALRPDYLSFFGHSKPTPFIDSFLQRATVFSEAITPLARTFPSWMGILTGQYPRESGIRSNLVKQTSMSLSASLPRELQHLGYETVYATDEARFSNIDHQYGFDTVITPPMGLNDFLIGTFNDFPMSNLLVNTKIGAWLFPYSYGNRAVHFTYQPDSFLQRLLPFIQQQRAKPLFLAIHFCLPHYPYLWADLPGEQYSSVERYERSVQRVDAQLRDFFAQMQAAHILDHAIVVMLSDHGEAFELSGDRITEEASYVASVQKKPMPRFYPPSAGNEKVNQSAGHGTDVLGLSQYRTLLAFQIYGQQTTPRIVSGVVSLLSIKPTVLDLLSTQHSKNSLIDFIMQRDGARLPEGHIFIESDFSPQSIRAVYPNLHDVVVSGIEVFAVDPLTTRLLVKDEMLSVIIHSKQYADIYINWMLALYPQDNHMRLPILINLQTGQWTDDLRSSFAQNSPAKAMLVALKGFYGDELSTPSV